MSFNKLNKVMVVATVLATISCLVPESAQALGRASGNSSDFSFFSFDLIPVQDTEENNILGVFQEAIKNFYIKGFVSELIPGVCKEDKSPCTINYGTLTVTKLMISDDGYVLTTNPKGETSTLLVSDGSVGEPITLMQLQDRFDQEPTLGAKINLKNGDKVNDIVMYNVTFNNTSSNPDLIWFIEPNDRNLDLINDLSGLSQFRNAVGIFPNGTSSGSEFTLTLVPEPTTTVGLLSLGALGTVSLLKRKKV